MVVPPWYEMPPRGYGGLETIVSALVDALVERGHDVTLIGAGRSTGTRARFVSTFAAPQFPRLNESLPDVLHAALAHRIIAAGDFDVIHDHTTPGPLAAGRHAPPTVVTVHGLVDGELGDYLDALAGTVHPVAISDDQRRSRPELPWLATVHNGVQAADVVDLARYDRPGGAAGGIRPDGHDPGDGSSAGDDRETGEDRPVVWLGRFDPDKGPDLAVDACRAAGLRLVLVGRRNPGSEEQFFGTAIAPRLDRSVQVMLNADRATALRRLASARCLLLPLRWREPFGMVLIEAMALGVPVVALRRGAVPEIVADGVTGIICDTADELPDALKQVGELDPQACRRHVLERFSADLMARRYEQVYLTAMAARPA
jgi:glycosyltransferase involved in cell wall biosynthesis